MRIQPASIDQVRVAADGRLVTITADAGGVAEGIRRLDACLRLRYSEAGDCWIVYRVHRNGEPCPDDDPERTEELVLTAQECDHRIVDRLEFIDSEGRGGYDYAKALEQGRKDRERQERGAFRERIGETAELAAHALRKDLGERYRGRTFVPRDI
jgi:hypothetical protein